jgi:hypothetical protein
VTARKVSPASGQAGAGGGRAITLPDRLLGMVGGAMIFLALVLLVTGGPADGETPIAGEPPAIELLAPGPGATLVSPLAVRFRTQEPIAHGPGGWGTRGYHVHLELNGRELMPAPESIRREGGGEYVWDVGRVPPGETRLRLFWSDAEHRPVPDSGTPDVMVRID